MKDFTVDESAVEKKPGNFTIEVDESVVEYNARTLAPQTKNPMDLQGAVFIPCAPENVVVARNYAEEIYRFNRAEYEQQNRREEEVISSIAMHKFAELCVSDFLNAKGISSAVDLKVYKVGSWEPEFTTVKTQKDFTFHVKATDVTASRRTNGPAFLISSDDPLHDFQPKHHVLGVLLSSDWKAAALLFCIPDSDTRVHLRAPMKYLVRKLCLYHITVRGLNHDDRWGCFRSLVQGLVQNIEVTDDDGLSFEG